MNPHKFNFRRSSADAVPTATLGEPLSDGLLEGYVRNVGASARDADTFRMALVHELRAPLQVLQGHLEALCDAMGHGAGAASGERSAGAMASGARLNAMRNMLDVLANAVEDVLQLGQGDVSHLPLHETAFEVRACLDDEVAVFAGTAFAKALDLACDIADDVPVIVWGDAARLRQILRTLLDNALKFTVCGGVAVRASWGAAPGAAVGLGESVATLHKEMADAAHLTIHVTDTGPGIPAGMENAVFAAFARADRSVHGTGLGLWMAQQWAQRMGGMLCVEPSKTGARFRLTVPLGMPRATSTGVAGSRVESPDNAGAPFATSMVGVRGVRGMKDVRDVRAVKDVPVAQVAVRRGLLALVVDDHVVNRAVLTEQLAALGCRVHAAEDLTEALVQWVAHDVDVVVTDVQLGGACGLTLARTLRALAGALGRRTPVVFAVTGSVVAARAARSAGIDEVLTKPASRQRLQQMLAVRWPCVGDPEIPSDGHTKQEIVPRRSLRDDPHARRLMREEMAKDMARFRRLIARRRVEDIAAAQALLHRMRGACRMFGDPVLTARCDRLSERLADCRIAPDDQG